MARYPAEADSQVLSEMTQRGIAQKKARELLAHLKPGQEVMDQLEYVDFLIAKDKRGKLENPPGLYVFYVRDNVTPPADFQSSRKTRLYQQAQELKNAELARRASLELEYDEYRSLEVKRFADALPAHEYQQLYDKQRRVNRGLFRSMTAEQLDDLTHRTIRGELENSGRVQLISLDEFIKAQTVPA